MNKKKGKKSALGVTHDLLVGVGAARVGDGHRGGALLAVPRELAQLRHAANGQSVRRRNIAIAVAIVLLFTAVAARPHVDRTLATSALSNKQLIKTYQAKW